MSFLDKVSSILPFGKPEEQSENFFALNIGPEVLRVCLWSIEKDKLKILNIVSSKYASDEEIISVTDKLLDQSLGDITIEPEKILFGVPDSWLVDDNLKDSFLALLRSIVKSLELKPMAYVSSSHAICHFLEKKENSPTTAILAGIGETHVLVTVSRGGKIDGTKVTKRSDSLGEDLEMTLLQFGEVEVLPSKMLIFSLNAGGLEKQKSELLSYPWMNRLSFLHLPKIEILEQDIEIKSVALAGGVELMPEIKYQNVEPVTKSASALTLIPDELEEPPKQTENKEEKDLGFIQGDVMEKEKSSDEEQDVKLESDEEVTQEYSDEEPEYPAKEESLVERQTDQVAAAQGKELDVQRPLYLKVFGFGGFRFIIPILIIILFIGAYIFLPQAKVTVFVEPRIVEKDTQVTADPKVKEVDEEAKKIPGQIVEIQVSGSEKGSATGKKEIGESAKGTVVITNKTSSPKTFSKGTALVSPENLKFTLDSSVTVASQSATEDGISFGKETGDAKASSIGADGNIPSGTQLTISGVSSSDFSAKTEGNFSGGTSKEVTVVSDSDQKKLLASLAASLRKQAQEKLQGKLEGKKVLEEALSEEITKKSFSKNINDQASEFSLNLTINYKGTAYSDDDLKRIVSKLVETNIPQDFELSLADTETQADVSKVEKDGRLVFLARFRAKLMPKIDENEIKKKLIWKTPKDAAEILKTYESVLGSEIKLTPSVPAQIARLPILERNIKIEVSLK